MPEGRCPSEPPRRIFPRKKERDSEFLMEDMKWDVLPL
jgi:hypothetical protein